LIAPDVTVVAAVHRLSVASFSHVADTCARLGVRMVPWMGESVARGRGRTIIVAGLHHGERHVASDLAVLLGDGCDLLLLVADELIQPTLSLWSGRIRLVGPPLTAARVDDSLGAMIAAAPPHDDGDAPEITEDDREDWSAVWIAPGGPRPIVHRGRALTALLATDTRPITSDVLLEVIAAIETPDRSLISMPALGHHLGDRIGLVQLDPEARQWTILWPRAEWPIWLSSPQRVPPWWDLGAPPGDGKPARLAAFAGDVVVAIRGALAPAQGDDDLELAAAIASGARATIDVIARRLRGCESCAALVVEVRS